MYTTPNSDIDEQEDDIQQHVTILHSYLNYTPKKYTRKCGIESNSKERICRLISELSHRLTKPLRIPALELLDACINPL